MVGGEYLENTDTSHENGFIFIQVYNSIHRYETIVVLVISFSSPHGLFPCVYGAPLIGSVRPDRQMTTVTSLSARTASEPSFYIGDLDESEKKKSRVVRKPVCTATEIC